MQKGDLIQEMYIPRSCCGRVIGKGGNKIREIQDMCHVHLQIHSKENPEEDRVRISISGNSQQNLSDAMAAIEAITNSYSGNGGDRPLNGGSDAYGSRSQASILPGGMPKSQYGQRLVERLQNLGVSLHSDERNLAIPPAQTQQRPTKHQQLSMMPMMNNYAATGGDPGERVMYIHSSQCGRIIGSGGNKIKELQQDSGARIQVDRNNPNANGDVPVHIRGNQENILRAMQLIDSITLGMAMPPTFMPTSATGFSTSQEEFASVWNNPHPMSRDGTDMDLRIMYVPTKACGRIIGSGGSKIKEMEQESGARIQLDRSNTNNFGDIAVQISGPRQSVAMAGQMLEGVVAMQQQQQPQSLSNGPPMSQQASVANSFMPHTYPPPPSNNYVNFMNSTPGGMLGGGGAAFRNPPQTGAAPSGLAMPPYDYSAAFGDSSTATGGMAPGVSASMFSPPQPQANHMMPSTYAGAPYATNDMMGLPPTSAHLHDIQGKVLQIQIPSKACGRLIGANGTRIQQLQEQTNTRIQIYNHSVNELGNVLVEIHGDSAERVHAACHQIECIVQEMSRGDMMMASAEESFQMKVPKTCVGRLIGTQGSMIRQLQDETQARIQVLNTNSGYFSEPTEDVNVEIHGSVEAITQAMNRITEIVQSGNSTSLGSEDTTAAALQHQQRTFSTAST